MIFGDSKDIKPLYFIPTDDLVGEVLVPAFAEADEAACMIGFFSSASLKSLAPGLATYLNRSSKKLKLIISPHLSAADRDAIESGTKELAEASDDAIDSLLITEDLIAIHTLKCLSHLISNDLIEIKVAYLKGALFHPKVWVFEHGEKVIAAHGSSNLTESGLLRNFEQITVSCSWEDPIQEYIITKLKEKFNLLWDNMEDECQVIPVSIAIKDRIVRDFSFGPPPSEEDFLKLYKLAAGEKSVEVDIDSISEFELKRPKFKIPAYLNYEEGAFKHQGLAVRAWCDANHIGILEMATGSGKTITSMIASYHLYKTQAPLLIIISAPYKPLINQWCDEVEKFGLRPHNITTVSGPRDRKRLLGTIKRRLSKGITDVEAIVTSHDILCKSDFQETISTFQCAKLLIGDEMHNLGRPEFINSPPDFIEYKLGLSATPIRQYDEYGTGEILKYFGDIVYQYTLKEAIGNCLVEYEYYVHPVYLTAEEMDNWYSICELIRQNSWRLHEKQSDDYLNKLFRDRRLILETAENKLPELEKQITNSGFNNIEYTLIYATDKAPVQLNGINAILNKHNILFHQLTQVETSSPKKTREILSSFQSGDLKVITAKRVLDEGVNIPQVKVAYILASTTVERQWVQRRGRLLRMCDDIDKKYSIIHDFIALPPDLNADLDNDAKNLVNSELKRIKEFANLARNSGRPDGPLTIIKELVSAIYF